MKAVLCLSAFLAVIGFSVGLQCGSSYNSPANSWKSMQHTCISKMKDQVKQEIAASMNYLAMAAHFSKDTVNRPGFAKVFFESAGEERQHAMKLIEYLLMRGELVSDLTGLITIKTDELSKSYDGGLKALEAALDLEAKVTNSILDVIKHCEQGKPEKRQSAKPNSPPPEAAETEPFNDYHLVDYLTGEFLEEQYQGQKVLADRISTLGKMNAAYGNIGEFLFDKQLLE